MKVLLLSGSRNRSGKTAQIVNAVAGGVIRAGGQTEIVFLPECKLERCRQCNPDGWGVCLKEQRCIIDDDFASVVAKIRAADVMVFASPVYFHDLSESLKGFLDRFRRLGFSKRIPQPGSGPSDSIPTPQGLPSTGSGLPGVPLSFTALTPAKDLPGLPVSLFPQIPAMGLPGLTPLPQGMPAIGICYSGGSGNGTTAALANLESTLQTCGFDCVDMITVRRQNHAVKLPWLEKTGEWLVTRPTSGPLMAPPR